jgi:hypothetical protein
MSQKRFGAIGKGSSGIGQYKKKGGKDHNLNGMI